MFLLFTVRAYLYSFFHLLLPCSHRPVGQPSRKRSRSQSPSAAAQDADHDATVDGRDYKKRKAASTKNKVKRSRAVAKLKNGAHPPRKYKKRGGASSGSHHGGGGGTAKGGSMSSLSSQQEFCVLSEQQKVELKRKGFDLGLVFAMSKARKMRTFEGITDLRLKMPPGKTLQQLLLFPQYIDRLFNCCTLLN